MGSELLVHEALSQMNLSFQLIWIGGLMRYILQKTLLTLCMLIKVFDKTDIVILLGSCCSS